MASRPSPTDRSTLAQHWTLDPEVTQLNHGSFGACPRPVLEAQQAYRDQLEREPTRFFNREAPGLLDTSREALAAFIRAPVDGLVFVPNVTTALNAVLRSLSIDPGDELLVTDHEYNASRNVLEYVAAKRGARVVVAQVPFPIADPQEAVDAVLARVGPRTRLALLDHVTSQTALVMPIETLVRELESRGVDVLVDGAHAPGMLEVDIGALRPAYYAANCHKWLCAPKGVGVLWVREDLRTSVRPAVISHGANARVPLEARFQVEFAWTGTGDCTPALALPTALHFVEKLLPGGATGLFARNRALALEARAIVAEALGVDLPCPDTMIGAMASLPVPPSPRFPPPGSVSALDADPLHEALFGEHGIEVPIITCPAHPERLLRISAQAYNTRHDYEKLGEALRTLFAPPVA